MAEILLYGIIGDPIDKLDAVTVTTAIRDSTGPLSIRINSPGGYVMEGLAIIQALRAYPGAVTVYIDGLAASMASAIAMIGGEVVMAESALLMVHKPWDSSIGNADDLRRDAAQLDRVEQQLIDIYAKRTGLAQGELAGMLAAETWFTSEEALAAGFVTSIAQSLKIAALADVSAFGFRHPPRTLVKKDSNMPEQQDAVALERDRATTIVSLCDKHAIPAHLKNDMLSQGTSLDEARAIILDRLATASDSAKIGHNSPDQTLDNPAFHADAVKAAIYARMSGKAPEGAARDLMGVTIVDLAREMLHARGVRNAVRMRPNEVLHPNNWLTGGGGRAAITTGTGDFPSLLQDAGHRFLLDHYGAAASVLKKVARTRTVTDFRQVTGISLSGFGVLDTLDEHAEYKNGSFSDRKESYKLSTFGKMFNLSRQALVNDDLGAFSDVLMIMGRAAAETEAVVLVALLNANPTLSDGKAVYHAGHGNLAAAGTLPLIAPLSDARAAMRTQKDADGVTPLNVVPRYIVAGAAQETNIQMSLAEIRPVDSTKVNPFTGTLEPLIDPRIIGNPWYLFGDPNSSPPSLETAYLDGQQQPFLDSELGWRVDGTEYKVRHDFGAGWVDWKTTYKNAGQ